MRTERKKKTARRTGRRKLSTCYRLLFDFLLEVWVTFLDQPTKENQCNLSCVGCTLENHSLRKLLTYLRNYGLNKLCRVFHLFNYMSKAAQTGLKRRRETELKYLLRQIQTRVKIKCFNVKEKDQKMLPKLLRAAFTWPINPSHPNLSMHILHTVLYTVP